VKAQTAEQLMEIVTSYDGSSTIDMDICTPSCPSQEVSQCFIDWALQSGAVKSAVIERNGNYVFHCEFDDPLKALACGQLIVDQTGIEVMLQPKNRIPTKLFAGIV
jgi:hypothetical protein